jgi:hypothetical protein
LSVEIRFILRMIESLADNMEHEEHVEQTGCKHEQQYHFEYAP